MWIRLLVLCTLASFVISARRGPPRIRTRKTSADDSTNPWETRWYYRMEFDHFTYSDNRQFDIKYLYNGTFYKPGGPIFFYTGNEGDIESFAEATGIMFDLAPQFNAALIFVEHRYYGATLPFGSQSFASIYNMGYLTSEQALQDYAVFLTELKTPNNRLNMTFEESTPVIAFGGSYGGMLSAWMRAKYPHIIDGAWAGSAPLLYFRGAGIDEGAFDKVTTATFAYSGCNNYIIANTWNAVLRLASTADGLYFLNTHFNLDPRSPITDVNGGWNLIYFFREALEYMAMVDYPYPTDFLTPMPGWPAKVACLSMNTPGTNFTDEELVSMVGDGVAVYYNYTGQTQYYCIDPNVCGDPATAQLGSPLGWPWQECSEIIIDMCSRGGNNDFFWDECGDNSIDLLIATCNATFAKYSWSTDYWNIDAVKQLYGLSMKGASNIILTQGLLDPWSSGGYSATFPGIDQNRGLYVIPIPDAGHHLDLRTPNTCDPSALVNARYQIVGILRYFIEGNGPAPKLKDLPPSIVPNATCEDIIGGYPWGQMDDTTTTLLTTTSLPTTTFQTTTHKVVPESTTTQTVVPDTTTRQVVSETTTTQKVDPNTDAPKSSPSTSTAPPDSKTSTTPEVIGSSNSGDVNFTSTAGFTWPKITTPSIAPTTSSSLTVNTVVAVMVALLARFCFN